MAEEQTAEATDESVSESTEESTEESFDESPEESVDDGGESFEDEDDAEDEGEPSEPAEESAEKTYKLNLYGKEVEVGEEQLVSLAQKASAADKNFQEADRSRQEMLQMLGAMKDEAKLPEVLQKLGVDPRQFAENYLIEQYKYEQMDEKEKRVLDAERRLQEYEQRDKQKEQEELTAKQQQEVAAIRDKLDEEIPSALKDNELDPTEYNIGKIAFYMESAIDQGTNITPHQAAMLVRDDEVNRYSKWEDMEPEQIAKLLPEKVIAKIKNYDLSQIKSPQDGNKAKPSQTTRARKRPQKKSYEELKKELDGQFGGDPWEV